MAERGKFAQPFENKIKRLSVHKVFKLITTTGYQMTLKEWTGDAQSPILFVAVSIFEKEKTKFCENSR